MIESRQVELDILFKQYAGEPPAIALSKAKIPDDDLTPADHNLLDKISRSRQGQKFQKLHNGEWKGDYESQSEADLAECSMLAFWCKKDPEQMDRIFSQSKLYRDKWDERHGPKTYGEMTIEKAISQTEKVYGESQTATKKEYRRANFELVQVGKIEARPPQWLIHDLIEHDSLALVFGAPASGKSLWAIDASLCVAIGMPFYGHRVRQGPVIYIAGEGHNGLKRRMMAWSSANHISHDDAPIFISMMPAALTDVEMLEQVQAAIELVSEEHAPPVLIVVDTLARNFGPGDENSTQDMSQFIQAVDALRASSKATILIVHHSGHSDKGRARGAMALKGALDAEYRLDKDENGIIRLEATKMKEAKYPEPCAFRIKQVALQIIDSEGEAQFSAVLESTSYAPPPQRGKAGQGKHQTNAVDILKTLQDEVRSNYSVKGKDPATARVSTEDWKRAMKSGGIPQQRISEVVTALRNQRIITEERGFVSTL